MTDSAARRTTPYFQRSWRRSAWYVVEKVRFTISEWRAAWRQR